MIYLLIMCIIGVVLNSFTIFSVTHNDNKAKRKHYNSVTKPRQNYNEVIITKDEENLTDHQNYYRNVYLQSDAWRRKRFLVLRRDNWTCQHCGGKASHVHHLKYARNIGKEPIDWLISLCEDCHHKQHSKWIK